MTRTALITGITGQDGSYLAEFLLEKGYKVYGMVRRASSDHFERIAHLHDKVELREGDLLDQLSIITLLHDIAPAFDPANYTTIAGTGQASLFLRAIVAAVNNPPFWQRDIIGSNRTEHP